MQRNEEKEIKIDENEVVRSNGTRNEERQKEIFSYTSQRSNSKRIGRSKW